MRFPWANILLLFLLILQAITGYWGMVNGRQSFRWVLWLHGIGAYSLVVLLYWKSNIILDTWRRKKRWTGPRIAFSVLALLLLLTLALGLLWTFQGPIYLFGFSLLSLHIYLAIPLAALMLWHSWQMRFIWRMPQALGRRLFLNTAVTSIAGLLLWRIANKAMVAIDLPGIKRRFTGSFERGSFGGRFPVVSWIADDPDPVDRGEWQLIVDGAVERPLRFTYDQFRLIAEDTQIAVLDCTGGWYTTQEWGGINVGRLLETAGVRENAASITFRAVSGYQRRFTLDEAMSFLLAVDVSGQPLDHGHGAPARLVAVEKRGVEWVKWVTQIHVNTSSKFWQPPLPLR